MLDFWTVFKWTAAPLMIFIFILSARATATSWTTICGRLQAVVSEGQLLWVAMIIATDSAYDAGTAAFVTSTTDPAVLQVVFVLQVAIAYVSVLLIVMNADAAFAHVEAVREASDSGHPLPVRKSGILVSTSAVLALSTICLSFILTFVTVTT